MTRPMMLPSFDPPAFGFAAPFWDAVDRRELALPRCSVCGRWQWYPESAGTDCTGGELIWESVATSGTLYSFTRVQRSFLPDGRTHTPYAVGMVDLDLDRDQLHGPRLVVSLADTNDYTVGDPVHATFVQHRGRIHPVFVHSTEQGRES